jgi:predicted GH43/DUF377 family glycosyl hydrolase
MIVADDEITVYYGAADEVICGATLSIKELLRSLEERYSAAGDFLL